MPILAFTFLSSRCKYVLKDTRRVTLDDTFPADSEASAVTVSGGTTAGSAITGAGATGCTGAGVGWAGAGVDFFVVVLAGIVVITKVLALFCFVSNLFGHPFVTHTWFQFWTHSAVTARALGQRPDSAVLDATIFSSRVIFLLSKIKQLIGPDHVQQQ